MAKSEGRTFTDPWASGFVKVRLLGEGSSSQVFEARHVQYPIGVAVKLWRDELSARRREEFARECAVQTELGNHPNIVGLYEAHFPDSGIPWVALELFENSLADLLDWPRSRNASLILADDVIAGLEAIHAAGYLHRDIKPSNVLVKHGRAALGDLGIAVRLGDEVVDAQAGSEFFVAPEVRAGGQPTLRSDVYSAALTIRLLFTGTLPPDIDRVLVRAASYDPFDRPADGSSFREQFNTAIAKVSNVREPSEELASHKSPNEFSAMGGPPLGLRDSAVRAVAALPLSDGRTILASGGEDGTIWLWDTETGAVVGRPIPAHDGTIHAIAAFTLKDGQALLASGSEDGTIWLWDTATDLKTAQRIEGDRSPVTALAALSFTDGRTILASGGEDGSTNSWTIDLRHRLITRGSSDKPSESDLLSRESLIRALLDIFMWEKSRVLDEGPTVVAIEGPWGSGKTSFMYQLRAALEGDSRATHDAFKPAGIQSRFTVIQALMMLRKGRPNLGFRTTKPLSGNPKRVTVWLNPWAYQRAEQIWAGITRELVDSVGNALHANEEERSCYWFTKNLRRIDRDGVRRLLLRRVRSPLLFISVFALIVPLATQLAIRDETFEAFGVQFETQRGALVVPAAILLLGVIHTCLRIFFAHAASFLPGSLLRGPASSGVFAYDQQPHVPELSDPLYHARSGYLYLVQHDVKELLEDLKERGGEVVIFIDDLDRCTPTTTVQVLEAINLFMSESFPRARFVLGLDPAVVAAHIDAENRNLQRADVLLHLNDPTPGWTFLRKLVQLPIALPEIPQLGFDRLLAEILGDATRGGGRPVQSSQEPAADVKATGEMAGRPSPNKSTSLRLSLRWSRRSELQPKPEQSIPNTNLVSYAGVLERNPEVRRLLLERLNSHSGVSVRDTKRLLTIWQYYARVLQYDQPKIGLDSVERAKDLVIVAEILTRWPAYQHVLRTSDPVTNLTALERLALVVNDDHAWNVVTGKLLERSVKELNFAKELRSLLTEYNGLRVSKLYSEFVRPRRKDVGR